MYEVVLEQDIRLDTLAYYAPDILSNCQNALHWLESTGQGKTPAADQLSKAIKELCAAGVEPQQTMFDLSEAELPGDFDMTFSEVED